MIIIVGSLLLSYPIVRKYIFFLKVIHFLYFIITSLNKTQIPNNIYYIQTILLRNYNTLQIYNYICITTLNLYILSFRSFLTEGKLYDYHAVRVYTSKVASTLRGSKPSKYGANTITV